MNWRPADIGFATRRTLGDMGHAARLLGRLLALVGPSFARARLSTAPMLFTGMCLWPSTTPGSVSTSRSCKVVRCFSAKPFTCDCAKRMSLSSRGWGR